MEQDYIKLYNAGFKVRRYYPELFEKLRASLSEEVEQDKAVLDGARQAELEIQKEQGRLNELNQTTKQHEQSKDQSPERD